MHIITVESIGFPLMMSICGSFRFYIFEARCTHCSDEGIKFLFCYVSIFRYMYLRFRLIPLILIM